MEPGSSAAETGPTLVNRPVPADWLALRRSADHRAREKSQHLVERLRKYLAAGYGTEPVRIVDVGAGTGSNQAWLAPRLGVDQHWILLDHDAALIRSAETVGSSTPQVSIQPQVGAIEDLPALLDPAPALVTCAALLDLLTPAEVKTLVHTVVSSDTHAQTAALFSLTVTGDVQISPEDPEDGLIAAAFDAHQRRGGILGPDAVETVAAEFTACGMRVAAQETDWELSADDTDLMHRYLVDRAAVAAEQDSTLSQLAEAWATRRLRQVEQHRLMIRVGHTDLLALPGSTAVESDTAI